MTFIYLACMVAYLAMFVGVAIVLAILGHMVLQYVREWRSLWG